MTITKKEILALKKEALTQNAPDMIICTSDVYLAGVGQNPFMTLKRWVKEYDYISNHEQEQYEIHEPEAGEDKYYSEEYAFRSELEDLVKGENMESCCYLNDFLSNVKKTKKQCWSAWVAE